MEQTWLRMLKWPTGPAHFSGIRGHFDVSQKIQVFGGKFRSGGVERNTIQSEGHCPDCGSLRKMLSLLFSFYPLAALPKMSHLSEPMDTPCLVWLNVWVRCYTMGRGFPDSSIGKESVCSAGDPSLIPGLGRSTGDGTGYPLQYSWASLVAQLGKNPPAMWETWVQSLGWEDPLEEGMATHSSILAWRIPWTV